MGLRDVVQEMKKSRVRNAYTERLGVVGIMSPNAAPDRARVAELLAEYDGIIVGRAELPCSERNMTLICVSIKVTTNVLGAFTGKLGLVDGVKVKSMLL